MIRENEDVIATGELLAGVVGDGDRKRHALARSGPQSGRLRPHYSASRHGTELVELLRRGRLQIEIAAQGRGEQNRRPIPQLDRPAFDIRKALKEFSSGIERNRLLLEEH